MKGLSVVALQFNCGLAAWWWTPSDFLLKVLVIGLNYFLVIQFYSIISSLLLQEPHKISWSTSIVRDSSLGKISAFDASGPRIDSE
jgi:hypothetical protein